ncbi:hypothetical protein OS122_02740 [Mycolicibacterium mucogenicum]|uniref:hypothetical protein n=1 Tax=Mycolicibacterium mucogenicum TaxID=56689 RepID=UPI00226A249C|nr:hypothetical protein [Mycolicibacterium mucogenicum]MCX8559816.1 hypothetical protein [Mycolicibacterium mucogenicum]
MSPTRISIHVDPGGEEHFGARESGNYFVKDLSPVTDDTEIGVDLGEDVTVYMTVGQWKALVGAVYLGIEAIPAKREQRLERAARAARAAERVPAGVPA